MRLKLTGGNFSRILSDVFAVMHFQFVLSSLCVLEFQERIDTIDVDIACLYLVYKSPKTALDHNYAIISFAIIASFYVFCGLATRPRGCKFISFYLYKSLNLVSQVLIQ